MRSSPTLAASKNGASSLPITGRSTFDSTISPPKQHGARRNAFAGRHQRCIRAVDLIAGSSAHLTHPLVDQIKAVHVGLGEAPARCVDRQPSSHLDPALVRELGPLPSTTKSVSLKRQNDERRESVVELSHLHVRGF